jgi:hypothetical protein
MEKEYQENVLGETSTHCVIRKVDNNIVNDLIIKEENETVKTLATDRTWTQELIPLTSEELDGLN